MKTVISIFLVSTLFMSGIFSYSISTDASSEEYTIHENFHLKDPSITHKDKYLDINLAETKNYITSIGKPKLPMITQSFTIPYSSSIRNVDVSFSSKQTFSLENKIIPVIEPSMISQRSCGKPQIIEDSTIYSSEALYPSSQFSYRVKAGLHDDTRVLYVLIDCYPVQYSPVQDQIYFYNEFDITIKYSNSNQEISNTNATNLLIITPTEFVEEVQPLIEHKERHGIPTTLTTTEEIYELDYPARDNVEQIKYYIREAIEQLNITYVLLIGSIYKVPIRTSLISLWGRWDEPTLTDLYYADIYTSNWTFSIWDDNNNDIFGEDEDDLDLFPDVHVGRLACDDQEEVTTVIDKIIHYEDETYEQAWYHDMIFIGGNTFRWNPGNEGEEINELIMHIMTDFHPSHVIWTSKQNFNREEISNAINDGAGFLDYSGHGFEHGMGTYPPVGFALRTYLTPYIQDLVNGYELPIIFFDACLTAKLDFILQDVLDYKQYRVFDILARLIGYNTSIRLPCYAWSFVRHQGGGAIATIGATRTAFGGAESGAGKLALEFFKSYDENERIGQMMTAMQNAYITDVPDDEFAVQEFILLGDPTLMMGGYP